MQSANSHPGPGDRKRSGKGSTGRVQTPTVVVAKAVRPLENVSRCQRMAGFGRAPQPSRGAPSDQQRRLSGPGGPEFARRKLLIDHSIGTSRSGELESLRLRLDLLAYLRAGGNAAPLHGNHGNHGRHGNHARGDGNPSLRFAKTVARRSGSFGAFLPASLGWSDGASSRGRCQDSTGATGATDARIEGNRVQCWPIGTWPDWSLPLNGQVKRAQFGPHSRKDRFRTQLVSPVRLLACRPYNRNCDRRHKHLLPDRLGVSAEQSIQPDKTPLLLTDSRVTACQQDNRPTGRRQSRS